MQDDRFVKKCYIMLLKDDSNGKVNWATCVRKCLYSAGLGYIWERQGVDNPNCFIRFFTSLLHEINTQDWNSSVSDNKKLSLYKSVKIYLFMKTILMYSMLENLDIVMLTLE